MSDEPSTPPPALRLKPRLKLAEPELPPVAPAPPAEGTPPISPLPSPPPPADAEPPKVRLKPRLMATPGDAEPATVPAAPAEPAVVAPPPTPEVIAAAQGMGLTPSQTFWKVEVPLALPVLLSGLRVAAVQVVGLAVLAALIGAGGFDLDSPVSAISAGTARPIPSGTATSATWCSPTSRAGACFRHAMPPTRLPMP